MKKIVALLLCISMCLSVLCVSAFAEDVPSVAIVVAGGLGDRSFYDSANEGLEELASKYGTVTKVIECKENGSMYLTGLADAAEACDIVFAVGWQFVQALPEAAEGYPDTKFVWIDNALEGDGMANVMSVVYAQNQGSFLVGYIAGKLSKTGVVGAVGGQDSATINDFMVGYEAGAKYANPDIKVDTRYANGFEDPASGKECALALYDAGCDIVFAVAGKTGEGVFEAAKDTGNYAIGVDSDQKYINPDVIICSMVKEVGKSVVDIVENLDERFQPATVWTANMATGYIDVGYGDDTMTQQVSDELKAEVKALQEKIISGEITVPTALN